VLAAVWRRVAVVAVKRQRHGDEQRHVQAGLLLDQLQALGRQGGRHITGPKAQGSNMAVADRGGKRPHQELHLQLEAHGGHVHVVDQQLNVGTVDRGDAVGRQVHHLRAAGIGLGAVGGRSQGGVLAPARNCEVAQVKVEYLLGDGGDLAAGRVTTGLRQRLQRRAEGAEHAVLLEGVGQGLVGILGAAEQERGGGQRSGSASAN